MSFKNKYKTREPSETIELLKNFFENKCGLTLEIIPNHSDIGTKSYRVNALYMDKWLLGSNGKGMTEEFALASALSELYERYCSAWVTSSTIKVERLKRLNKEKNNYEFDRDEKQMTLDEIKETPFIREFLDDNKKTIDLIGGEDEYIKSSLNNADHCIGLPYKNIITEDIKYINPKLIHIIEGSTGLAAGNSFVEAFNQGMSEIFERYAHRLLLTSPEVFDKFYVVNHSCLTEELQDKICKLEQQGFEIFILDLSYNLQIPVVTIIFRKDDQYALHYSIGSFADFNIAVERCITEVLQNKRKFLENRSKNRDFAPNNLNDRMSHYMLAIEHGESLIVPENFIEKMINVDTYYKECYPDLYSNDDIQQFYFKLIKNLEWDIYVRDFSLDDQMFAIGIIVYNKSITKVSYDYKFDYDPKWFWESNKEAVRDTTHAWIDLAKQFESGQNIDTSDILYIGDNLCLMIKNLVCSDLFTILCRTYTAPDAITDSISHRPEMLLMPYMNVIINDPNKFTTLDEYTQCTGYKELKKFLTIRSYKIYSDLTDEQILERLKTITGVEHSLEDIQNSDDLDYLVQKIYIEPLQYWCNNYLDDIIKPFIK